MAELRGARQRIAEPRASEIWLTKAGEGHHATVEQYESLVQNIPATIYSSLPDEARTTAFISGRWEDWTGYTPEDFCRNDQVWCRSIHPDDRELAIERYREACQTGRDYVAEYRVVHKDTGEARWVRDHGVPVTDENGKLVRFCGVVTEIAECRQADEELARRVLEAGRVDRPVFRRAVQLDELTRQVDQLCRTLGIEPPRGGAPKSQQG